MELSLTCCSVADTGIPPTLVLYREEPYWYSLQPSRPLQLDDFNKVLDNFYSEYATFMNAVEWMDKFRYHTALLDDRVEELFRQWGIELLPYLRDRSNSLHPYTINNHLLCFILTRIIKACQPPENLQRLFNVLILPGLQRITQHEVRPSAVALDDVSLWGEG
ncbi:uncharacterized protein ASPGLDRAFT_235683 [Aspergillus glaucus CBS 516.65]|uniref:Tse2 ADP-ribosyltransferase toxin domain-containing protein n=1 Tax=Aspergillus glaucus CBS 516.65 TaxID=1160497 RepID=A0A1L9VZP5_ASPGL|nr:hypothetical protein ASPGLDRAFT_235683 [Aspergillus glaucus CBS 516.65]OJJ89400.1 hypothetical protein ASPGLDRAFT_235683 [Aspergillus glaucus CBS 516.65]